MRLRQLDMADARPLLEWLRDKRINRWLDGDMDSLTISDVESFICGSMILRGDEHRAITDDSGDFLGLISLKHLDKERARAELGLGLALSAQGKGNASPAAEEMLELGFERLGLELIYGCVCRENTPALSFCRRFGLTELAEPPKGVVMPENSEALRWFGITKEQWRDKYRK